jgi:immune inhibitor A
VDYIQIRCKGDFTLHFEGNQQVEVVPANPYSGSYAFYSNRGDESDMTLTRTFDFRGYSGQLTLTYWTWFDIEKDYDYLYLTSSLDGVNWKILTTPSGTADDPSGNSYGWAYNGWSGEGLQWIQERVDISQFAGKEVQIRFEYVTDEGVYGDGFLLDDVAVPEIDYFTDFESDDGGWQASGFVRIQNVLPQTFRISLINFNGKTTVEKLMLSESNILDIPISIDDELILVISGTTRFTHQKATYQFSILP